MDKQLNCHIIYGIIIFILICIAIRLYTNKGKILNEFFRYISRTQQRYNDCINAGNSQKYCRAWA